MINPFAQFDQWFSEAAAHPGIADATAMALATASIDGRPSVRMVLLKQADTDGFVFYTNLTSQKGSQLKQNPQAELCFYWMPMERQIRIYGMVQPVTDQEADTYFHSRSRGSQIGAWASHQSQPLATRDELLARYHAVEAEYAEREIPRPPHWFGWRLVPETIEFWQAGTFRLHERERFTRSGADWSHTLLNP